MKFNKDIRVFGDTSFRGNCPKEDIEQINFYSWLRFNHPQYASRFMHPKTEGKRTWGQIAYEKKTGGIPTSIPDAIIIDRHPFTVELKRKDHTKSKWQDGQEEKLVELADAGCFTGVALGADGLKEAFLLWLDTKDAQ